MLLAVFAGGAIGAVARAELAVAWAHAPASWPWATFAVNITGALLLGYVATALRERQAAFWGAGVCGALTTFSTMQLELLRMLDRSHLGLAAAYASASIVLGLAAVRGGRRIAGGRA